MAETMSWAPSLEAAHERARRYPGTPWAMKVSFVRQPPPSEGRRAG